MTLPFQAIILGIEIQIRRNKLDKLVKNNDLTSDIVIKKSRELDDLVTRHYYLFKVKGE